MTETESRNGDRVPVEWRRVSPADVATPIVRQRPYVELKLEHPTLDPSGYGDGFFPDSVPYELDGPSRVFYWRPALSPSAAVPDDWEIACATTHALVGIGSLPTEGPPLVTGSGATTALVVEGTVGGDATVCHVRSYSAPDVSIAGLSASSVELAVEDANYSVSAGERRRIRLADRRVEPVAEGGGPTAVTPELVVRYPGRRELHHPARDAAYRLFPSFGLDLATVPKPLPVPTAADELDESTLAADVGVDLSQRPYPERVLWQAFAYTAFDPHAEAVPALTQLDSGHIVLRTEERGAESERVRRA